MFIPTQSRRNRKHAKFIVPALLCTRFAVAEVVYTATSQPIQDGLVRTASSRCPVAQDGYTSSSFPWTHEPSCVDVTFPSDNDNDNDISNNDKQEKSEKQTFCVYTNVNYNNGRGISFVVTPETAASVTSETFGMGIGGLEGITGQEMGMWEVGDAGEKGKGLFAKKDIGAIFAGESVLVQTPVLFVAKKLLEAEAGKEKEKEKERVLDRAVQQLPEETRRAVEELNKSHGEKMRAVVKTNGIVVKWPWVDETPELYAVVPEAARINHACRPNALWRFNDYTLSFEVFALKTIKPGDEITLSYGFSTRSSHRRQRSIQANLHFTCLCPLCTSSPSTLDASNDRLSEIKALKSVLPTSPSDTPQLIALLPKLIEQLELEDLPAEVPMYEEMLAYTWSSFGIEEKARYWAGRAKLHWGILTGRDGWEARRCGLLEEDVRGHETWMSWEGEDPWEGVGVGHPWDEREGEGHEHEH